MGQIVRNVSVLFKIDHSSVEAVFDVESSTRLDSTRPRIEPEASSPSIAAAAAAADAMPASFNTVM